MSGEIDAPWVRLELISRPEAARLVRSMSSAAGEALGFDPELLADVNTGGDRGVQQRDPACLP